VCIPNFKTYIEEIYMRESNKLMCLFSLGFYYSVINLFGDDDGDDYDYDDDDKKRR
jgi:hypothetical protein